jgi:hypothetical protein
MDQMMNRTTIWGALIALSLAAGGPTLARPQCHPLDDAPRGSRISLLLEGSICVEHISRHHWRPHRWHRHHPFAVGKSKTGDIRAAR